MNAQAIKQGRISILPLLTALTLTACASMTPDAPPPPPPPPPAVPPPPPPPPPPPVPMTALGRTISAAQLNAATYSMIGDFPDTASALAAWRAAHLPAGRYGVGTIAGRAIAISGNGAVLTIMDEGRLGSGAPLRPPSKPPTQ